MVVVGSRGRGGIAAQSSVRSVNGSCSTPSARSWSFDEEEAMKPLIHDTHLDRFDSLVVASDFTATSDRILPVAGTLARRGGLPVQVVTTTSAGLEQLDRAELSARAQRIHGCPVIPLLIDGGEPSTTSPNSRAGTRVHCCASVRTGAPHSVRPSWEA
jgi:hypothetical protein